MTKKILALALAGTTAFSVFASAMSVSAAVSLYTPQAVKTTAVDFTATYDTDAFTKAAFTADVGEFEDAYTFYKAIKFYSATEGGVMAVPSADDITAGTVYLYDYDDSTEATAYKTAVENFIAFYEAAKTIADKAADDAVWGAADTDAIPDGTVGNTAYTKGAGLLAKLDEAEDAIATAADALGLQESQNNADRRKAVIAMEDLKEDLRPVSDFDSASDDYDEYAALVARINGISTPFTGVATSELTWLKARVDAIVGDLYEADTEDADVLIERYSAILDARTADDYKKASEFTRFEADYAKIVEDYDGKTSVTKRNAYAADLRTLILKQGGESSGIDKTALESLLTEADTIVRAADGTYDKTSDAWSTFTAVKALAEAVKDQPKKYSYQSTVDTVTTMLSEAMDGVGSNSSVSNWQWLRLENAVEAAEALEESDFTAASWKKFVPVLTRAQNLMSASYASPTSVLAAAEALEAQLKYNTSGTTHLVAKTPSTADRKALQTVLKEAKEKLATLDKNTSGYQMLALSNAITTANGLFQDDKQTTLKQYTLISEVANAKAALEAAMVSANQPQGWYTNEAGKWMYGEGDGYYVDGWKKIGNFWFEFDANGVAKQNEWVNEGGKWYYFGNSCVAYTGWGKIDGKWYYFGKDCAMVTGWIQLGTTWYYLTPGNGEMVTGWATIGGKSYYFSKEANTLGAMLANTTTPDGYKVGADGAWVK